MWVLQAHGFIFEASKELFDIKSTSTPSIAKYCMSTHPHASSTNKINTDYALSHLRNLIASPKFDHMSTDNGWKLGTAPKRKILHVN